MAKKKATSRSAARSTEPLYRDIRAVLESARAGAYRAVNAAMVEAYWQVGRLIVEHEQGGHRRAAYGEGLLEDLSRRLTADFGRGFTVTNLGYMRQFFFAFPIPHALRGELHPDGILNALRAESGSWENGRQCVPNRRFPTQRVRNLLRFGPSFPGPTIACCSASKTPPRASGT